VELLLLASNTCQLGVIERFLATVLISKHDELLFNEPLLLGKMQWNAEELLLNFTC
jgi:hypothetical protein